MLTICFQIFVCDAFDVVKKSNGGRTKVYLWFPAAVVGLGRIMRALTAGGEDGQVETIEEVSTSVSLLHSMLRLAT